ncbi:hypothetical protein QNA23_18465 [Rhodococcus erythropolis]|uniref:hypothetical protein n=1 Tax=Rhodococcus erythropolis TaxID=1833 RepID=UPI0024B95D1D|nr:hypothetical protein [Rhodococcus erythropolis]MDJ0405484.1 hypothetical protein [Rhodococcus erythropolis]
MSIGVGVRIGTLVSTAVVASNDPGSADPVVLVRDTILNQRKDGTTVLGGTEQLGAGREFSESWSGFVGRVGDPSGVSGTADTRYRAEDLVATSIRCLLQECEPLPDRGGRSGGAPDIVATYPSRWDSSTAALMQDSLVYAGLARVTLVSDAEAVSAWFESEIAALAGTLIGIYHVDDTGAAVTLVRSGVAAGRAFGFAGDGSSPSSRLATALGAFGWMPENLDAVVVTGDGEPATDKAAMMSIAAGIAEKLGVRCELGPGPEQSAALGAAILAAGFTSTSHTIVPIGLPPSHDVTEVFDTLGREKVAAETATGVATVEPETAVVAGESESRGSNRVLIGLTIVVVLAALAVLAYFLLL